MHLEFQPLWQDTLKQQQHIKGLSELIVGEIIAKSPHERWTSSSKKITYTKEQNQNIQINKDN